ncbi:MAG TPA: hypothetical protein VJB99_01050 [Patescibacteria group bacterium]|nr:hypothetical protein [Patescibacteria group bacterium]
MASPTPSRSPSRLVELLAAGAVIALLGVLAAVAVSSARSKQRDAVRLSHVRQLQSAFEDYFLERNEYPSGVNMALGRASAACLDTEGFRAVCDEGAEGMLLRVVPAALSNGLKGDTKCGDAKSDYCYSRSEDGQMYVLQFELENSVQAVSLVKGVTCATPEGLSSGVCPAP